MRLVHGSPRGSEFYISVFMLGLTSIVVQIILLREFLSFFYGNELVLGLILANWMLLTGLGAYLGRNAEHRIHSLSTVLHFLTVLAVLPLILVLLMYYLRNIVFAPGSMLNLLEIYLSSLVILLPFCLTSGLTFTFVGELTSRHHQQNLIGKVYSRESLGSLVGGVAFNLVLIWFFKTFEALALLAVVNLLVLIWLGRRMSSARVMVYASVLLGGVIALNVFTNPDLLARQFLYQGHEVEYYKSSPYGNVVVTRQGGQVNFYENQVLLFSSQQPALNEESVHYPMLQHTNPRNVLLLSGGTPGVISEILKYPVKQIDYVEINPWLLRAVRKYSGVYDDSRVHVVNQDARLFVNRTKKRYDAALIQLPEPSTVQLNRFYTLGFYKELQSKLNPGAVIGFSISGSSNYMAEEERQLNSSLYQTLGKAFDHVIIIPGLKHYFVASNQPLSYQVTRLVKEHNLDNEYVNSYYVDDKLLQMRAGKIMENLLPDASVNRDFRPITYFLSVRQWLSQFDFNYWTPLVIIVFVVVYLMFTLHPVNLGMFSAGFAGASVEVLLLVAFQILYGYVYSMVGFFVTIFMAGLVIGTFYRERLVRSTTLFVYYRLIYGMGGFILLTALFLTGVRHWTVHPFLLHAIFMILMFLTALFTGMIFSLASKLRLQKWIVVASEIYSVDLLGAGLGTFLVSVYLVPLLGLVNVFVVTAFLCLLSGVVARLRLGTIQV